jgi:hypothetical protein
MNLSKLYAVADGDTIAKANISTFRSIRFVLADMDETLIYGSMPRRRIDPQLLRLVEQIRFSGDDPVP